MSTFKMRCPECGAPLVVEAQPRERQTHEYPGAVATIYAEGCPHAETIPEDDLWSVFFERRYRE
jgi:hypothetical protein